MIEDEELEFLAMARATKKNVVQWKAIPQEAFEEYHPPRERNANLKIAVWRTLIKDCKYPVRPMVVRDDTPLSKQRWRVIFTDDEEIAPEEADKEYRSRQAHEDALAQIDHCLAAKCLPKPFLLMRERNEKGQKRKTVGTQLNEESLGRVQLVAWLRHWAFNLVKDFGVAVGEGYGKLKVGTLVRKFIVRPGMVYLKGGELWVKLAPFRGCEALTPWIKQVNQQRMVIPWLNNLVLQLEVASIPMGLAARPVDVRHRIFANRAPPLAV